MYFLYVHVESVVCLKFHEDRTLGVSLGGSNETPTAGKLNKFFCILLLMITELIARSDKTHVAGRTTLHTMSETERSPTGCKV